MKGQSHENPEESKKPNAPVTSESGSAFDALAGCGVVFLTGIVCAIVAPAGAQAGGLHQGGWNWQFIPSIFAGGFAGLFLSTATIVAAKAAKADTWAGLALGFVMPVILTVLGAAVFYAMR